MEPGQDSGSTRWDRGAVESARVADLLDDVPSDRLAIVDGSQRVTYGELADRVAGTASGLLAMGLSPGARVLLRLPTGLDFVVCYLAASRAGLVVVPVNPAYTPPEIRHVLVDSGSALMIGEPIAAGAADLTEGVVTVSPSALLKAGQPDDVEPVDAEVELPADPPVAVLLYTSGTSGRPKGAMLSARALLANLEQIAGLEPRPISSTDVVFVPIPLFHVFGLNVGIGGALDAGATLVLADRFDAGATLEVMAREHVSAVLGVPGMYAQWAAHAAFGSGFAAVRCAWSGSAALPRSLVRIYAEAGIGLYEGYGLTESAPVIASNWRAGPPKPGAVGRPLPGVEVSLRDVDGGEVEDDDPGEVFVRGANLFVGYWPDGAGGPDDEGWFGTGDLAYADDDGDLHLVGRTTDLVIVNGFNVYPAEVERVLRGLDGVGEAAVLGVPDPATGESLRAYVVAAPGAELDPDVLLAAAARELARFKLPKRIEIVDDLPHTVTGKVMKWRLLDGGD